MPWLAAAIETTPAVIGLSVVLLSGCVVPFGLWLRGRRAQEALQHQCDALQDRVWELRAAAEARDRAEAASDAKSRFLATISHEIRTPLAGIVGMANLLAGTTLEPEQQTYVEAVRASGVALSGLIDEILDLSRIEAGRLDLAREPFDPAALAEEVVELLGPRAQDKGLEIAIRIDPDLPSALLGDAPRLRQVLLNLAGNAIKFTEVGGLGLRMDRVGGDLRVSVADTGPGVPPDRRAAIFEEFEQGDGTPTRRHGGAGLGLAISRRIVEGMGGVLGYTPREGGGSVFSVSVPLPVAEDAPPRDALAWPDLSGQLALVLSPAIFLPDYLAEDLEGAGASVRLSGASGDGTALIEAAAGTAVAIFIDASYGAAVCHRFIAQARNSGDARVILLMSPGERQAFGRQLLALCDGWLVKPIRTRSLVERLVLAPLMAMPAVQAGPGDRAAGHPHVLLAEDNPVNALIARKSLERLGATVTAVADGAAALDAAKRAILGTGPAFDLVLMDVSMPRLDGVDVTRRVRALEIRHGRTPTRIVALTAHAFPDDHLRFRLAGMDDVLTKPVDPAVFARLIEAPDQPVAVGA